MTVGRAFVRTRSSVLTLDELGVCACVFALWVMAEMQRWQKELGDTTPLVVEKPQDPSWDPAKRPEEKGKAKKANG